MWCVRSHPFCAFVSRMKIRGGRVHVADTVKLSNMLLNQGVVKLCDYGCAAWMSETKYPTAFSVRWCSPYRLGSNQDINPRPLIPEEDIYASAITVWELFVGENPYGPFVSQDDEFELWDRIV